MPDLADVCVLLPTLNEAETVGEVIDGFHDEGFEHVLVVDGNSTDATRSIARDHGAEVVTQSGTGKGQAVREGVAHIDQPYVLMADGDGTYRPEDAEQMLEPLFDGRADHVIGDRFADMEPGAMTRLNAVGNWLINRLFAAIHGRNLKDILSGYRAFSRESFERFRLDAEGFGIETELAAECVRQGVPTEVVPIRYEARPGGSETNLNPLTDGGRIMLTMYTLTKTNNPLFYFGSISAIGTFIGVGLAGYVGYEYFVNSISHDVIALLAAFFVLLSAQLLMFGVLSDIIVSVNREQTRRLEELSDRLRDVED
ncbi:MAG: glycosyltransferase (TIGR04182 family) [Natronomonas sp.]|jgi:glycosyltransferase (TIGR04182 family)|uniref:S-layer glycoprotein N-glycosyltransferase AglJ n=1 Tax=Natronomonas sp. TaxID=2184060 RepID=UPI0039E64504